MARAGVRCARSPVGGSRLGKDSTAALRAWREAVEEKGVFVFKNTFKQNDVWEVDSWCRAAFGLPPEGHGDFAWVQHMVASMATRAGRMAVVLPQGAFFRKEAEGWIRQALLERDLSRWSSAWPRTSSMARVSRRPS